MPALSPALQRSLATLALAGALAGCATAVPVPDQTPAFSLPRMLHVTHHVPGRPAADGVLVVQAEAQGTRWSLFDPLGAPQARQILHAGNWRNDGFLPPNDTARTLFSALVFAWTPAAELAARYGAANVVVGDGVRTLAAHGRPVVTARSDGMHLRLELGDGTHWTVAPLETQ
ncbi:hypothetical protein [Pseudothauera rhizosphaerae]|uniref:Lipoprotein n=1 Tax=Pseudothauera rhizosphaerae TaxID=2565932 RepID=A0A4V3WBC6_9RHOO|nr:hypothetical protein [Pseudothauera rhizosphaerae]THF62497.1 hypothetical protein E6O51_05870 [Pseudothauera rhizosphaerae]